MDENKAPRIYVPYTRGCTSDVDSCAFYLFMEEHEKPGTRHSDSKEEALYHGSSLPSDPEPTSRECDHNRQADAAPDNKHPLHGSP